MTAPYTPGPRQAKAEIPVLDAQQIEPKPMRVEVHEYAWLEGPPKRRRYVDPSWLLALGFVACVSGVVALVMLAGGMW